MIFGTGIDILQVRRMKETLVRTPGFEKNVFAPREIQYCRSKAFPEQHFAARFAAKEAFMKALGTGWRGGIRFQDIIICVDPLGKPFFTIENPTRDLIPEFHQLRFHLSITHDKLMAAATVTIEKIS